jgi:hypothetical protein
MGKIGSAFIAVGFCFFAVLACSAGPGSPDEIKGEATVHVGARAMFTPAARHAADRT